MKIDNGFLYCKKSEMPIPVVVEDDRTGNIVVQELQPGNRRPGCCVREAAREVVRRVNCLMK